MLVRWREKQVSPCTIVGAPFFKVDIFELDWLHIMDLGVCCDFLGNCFLLLLQHKPGTRKEQRVRALYLDIVEYYNRTKVESRLDSLTESMLVAPNRPPKLRAKAAEARFLVPFCKEQAARHLVDTDPEQAAAKAAAAHLHECYECLHEASFDHVHLRDNSRKFCILYAALERVSGTTALKWRMKPKMHLMQELCEMATTNPSKTWTYRDEDFGGSIAAFARIRGGPASAKVVGTNVLQRFRARHDLPVF